jgi:hypothetical protein
VYPLLARISHFAFRPSFTVGIRIFLSYGRVGATEAFIHGSQEFGEQRLESTVDSIPSTSARRPYGSAS